MEEEEWWWFQLFNLLAHEVCTNVDKAEKFVRDAHSKGANIILIQLYVGTNGFQMVHEVWSFKVQKYCSTTLLLVLNHKMMVLILVTTRRK